MAPNWWSASLSTVVYRNPLIESRHDDGRHQGTRREGANKLGKAAHPSHGWQRRHS
jgi:hypothetical protein